MRRRRPLMRAAMVGGGAYMAGKHVARGQEAAADQEARIEQLEAQQSVQAAPPPAAPAPVAPPPAAAAAGDDLASKLMDLKNLMDQGVLSPEEFQQAKAKLLGS
ncbi:MAG TPA: SHOCT domain-containing protein [Gaiellales bacterium]|nr:SHOCT domain-containing protein [Gaiellales bacterium]